MNDCDKKYDGRQTVKIDLTVRRSAINWQSVAADI